MFLKLDYFALLNERQTLDWRLIEGGIAISSNSPADTRMDAVHIFFDCITMAAAALMWINTSDLMRLGRLLFRATGSRNEEIALAIAALAGLHHHHRKYDGDRASRHPQCEALDFVFPKLCNPI